MLVKTIEQVLDGTIKRKPQDVSGVTFAPRLKKETGKINWHKNVSDIINLIRGLNPLPTAYTYLDGQSLKIFTAEASPEKLIFYRAQSVLPMQQGYLLRQQTVTLF